MASRRRAANSVRLTLALLLAATAQHGPARAATNAPGTHDLALEATVAHLAAVAPGIVGVSAVHLESGRWIGVHAEAGFPMQSTVKLPVALAVLDAVDHHRLSLQANVHLFRWDMQPWNSPFTERFPRGGADASVHDLLDAMLTRSDNTASDVLVHLVGGPAAVTAWLRAHGVTAMRMDRTERQLGDDWSGLETSLPDSAYTAARLGALREAVPAARRTRADTGFSADPRDHASPAAFTALLARIQRGGAAGPEATDTLLAMMSRCATGAHRLPGLLPPGCRVAHKTGTAGTWRGHTHAVNDVGLVTLASGGHVAIAVMVRDVHGNTAVAEQSIARIARAVCEAWSTPAVRKPTQ